jgi:hypothetical protein
MSTFNDDLLSSYTDADLLRYVLDSPCPANNVNIALLSARYVAKAIKLGEFPDVVTATEFALSLGVRTPCIERIVCDGKTSWCIM